MQHEKKITAVRLDDAHLQILDDLRRLEADIPNRSEMIRRVIERAGQGGLTIVTTSYAGEADVSPPAAKGKRR